MSVYEAVVELVYEVNLCKVMFVAYALVITFGGTVINFLGDAVPVPHLLQQAFKFGKMAHGSKVSRLLTLLEVPRRWFLHFYISASVVVMTALTLTWQMYVWRESLPPWASTTFDVLTTPHRTQAISATSAVLALCLLAIQIYRRLYENLFISVFSSGRMNILHYIVGHTHYLGAVLLLLYQAPGFVTNGSPIVLSKLEVCQVVGVFLCLLGFVVQHRSLCFLAALRRDKGTSEKYLIPRGELFEVVSCPHMLAEVVVYVGILIILNLHSDWLWVTFWVLTNQVQVAVMNHKWYQDTFKDYPKQRRAIIPFLL